LGPADNRERLAHPEQALVMEQEVESLLVNGAINWISRCSHSNR